jgi:ATP-dependent DNA helicase PIF1
LILDSITTAIYSRKPQLFFIDGPGGTRENFVENLLLANVRSRDRVALAVASSGIAAILHEGGRTSHSRFKIPLDIHSESLCNVSAQCDLANLLQITDLIVWDEAPAQNRHCLEAVDRTLKAKHLFGLGASQWFLQVQHT